jgi:hypothetical protein
LNGTSLPLPDLTWGGVLNRYLNAVEPSHASVTALGNAFSMHDPSLLEGLLAEDCILENTGPAPDGARYDDRAVRRWRLR